MNICKIESIIPGKPWESQHGTMHSFTVVFADGVRGEANSKTNPPPYKVGDKVGYEIAGQTPRGQNKLKIDRKADPAVCRDTTPAEHPDFEAAVPVSAREEAFHGQSQPVKPASQTFGRVAPSPAQNPVKSSQNAQERLPVNLPHGATVGGALARAIEVWRHVRPAGSGQLPDQQDLEDIESLTRALVAIQGKIERGEPMEEGEPW